MICTEQVCVGDIIKIIKENYGIMPSNHLLQIVDETNAYLVVRYLVKNNLEYGYVDVTNQNSKIYLLKSLNDSIIKI